MPGRAGWRHVALSAADRVGNRVGDSRVMVETERDMRHSYAPRSAVFAILTLLLAACGGGDKVRLDTLSSGVNPYLWRAAIETLSFMPMLEVDPRAGAIITDWYANPEAPRERMKVSAFIMGSELRADTLRVSVVRQIRDERDIWLTAPVEAGTVLKIEDAILAKARQLRIDSMN